MKGSTACGLPMHVECLDMTMTLSHMVGRSRRPCCRSVVVWPVVAEPLMRNWEDAGPMETEMAVLCTCFATTGTGSVWPHCGEVNCEASARVENSRADTRSHMTTLQPPRTHVKVPTDGRDEEMKAIHLPVYNC